MPALKYSEEFFWLISKQDNSLTIGLRYKNEAWMELLGSEDDHTVTWVQTHFHMIPMEIPLNILEYNSPQAGSNIPKG